MIETQFLVHIEFEENEETETDMFREELQAIADEYSAFLKVEYFGDSQGHTAILDGVTHVRFVAEGYHEKVLTLLNKYNAVIEVE